MVSVNFKCRNKITPWREKDIGKKFHLFLAFSSEAVSSVPEKDTVGSLGSLSAGQGVMKLGPWLQPRHSCRLYEAPCRYGLGFLCASPAFQVLPGPLDLLVRDS